MRKAAPWIILLVLAIVLLLSTGTLSISYESDEPDVSGAIDDVGDGLEDAADELTGN